MLPVLDCHVDALQRALDLGHDLGTETPGHLDLAKGARGGLRAVVLTAWIDASYAAEPGAAKRRTNALLDAADDLFARHPGLIHRVTDGSELIEPPTDSIACILAIEGGHAIEDDLDQLDHYAARGVRVMTLTWNNHLSWARSCQKGATAPTPEGLSPFGREVVRRMGELGMLVDISHVGERTFFDALEEAASPPLVSHSGCGALSNHPRNISDDQLRALAERDGVIGIPFVTAFLDEEERAAELVYRKSEGHRAIHANHESTEGLLLAGEAIQAALPPFPIERLADHILHALEVAGPRHVAIGSDFDGIDRRPAGLEDASCYPVLWDLLRRRGVDEETLAGIAYGNAARVIAAATAVVSPR